MTKRIHVYKAVTLTIGALVFNSGWWCEESIFVTSTDEKPERCSCGLLVFPEESILTGKCEWKADAGNISWGEGLWSGACGAKWNLGKGTPETNDMAYCPRCGKNLVMAAEG